MTQTLNPLTPTPSEPITEILHGVVITDPYRWLEDQNSPRTRSWLERQASHTRAYLDAIPNRERIRKRVEELLAVEVVSEPWKVGHRYVYLKRRADQEQAVIMTRETDSDEEIVLVDPVARGEGSRTAVNIVTISGDASVLAYSVKHDGTDTQSVEFLDISRRQILPDRLPNGFGPALIFSPDRLGFYYAHEIAGSTRPDYRAVYFHYFGSHFGEDREVFFAGEDANVHVGVFGSSDGSFLGYVVDQLKDPETRDLYLQDLASGRAPKKIVEGADSAFCPFFVKNRLCALTNRKAPHQRIVVIDYDNPDVNYWADIVPEGEHRIERFTVVDDWVCVSYFDNYSSRVEAVRLTDRRRITVPCPCEGKVDLVQRPVVTDTLFYELTTFNQPATIFSFRPSSCEHKIWARADAPFDPSSITLEQVRYKSRDGTEVPMYLVRKNQRISTTPFPTLLTGYGGFGYNHTPQFKASSTILIENGFLFAIASVRGGGELGEEWHLAGKRHRRQRSVDDFISAAEWLVGNGYADPDKVAISGGSNAGLLVGAALTQRPDLFRAVVCSGPLLDMLRYHRFDLADRWIDEYGSSENQEDFPHLLAYSPYHCVKDRVLYPAVMLVSGDADTRCNPMHARKMAARLQAATHSGRPILLNYMPFWGHMPVQPLNQRIDIVTDRLTFIFHELGLDI